MLRNDVSYPYPVLREETVDFKQTVFNDTIEVKNTPTGYTIIPRFSVNNDEISRMIAEGVLGYAVYLTCQSTMLREMRYIDDNHPIIEIDAGDVHYKVSYKAYIVALKDIEHYQNMDFEEDYQGIDFSIDAGAVVGIGKEGFFSALFKTDVISDASAIITVSGSETDKYMRIDLECNKITVVLPADQRSLYGTFGSDKRKHPLLEAVLAVPALVEAVSAIGEYLDDPDNYPDLEIEQRAWFITLDRHLDKLAEKMRVSKQDLCYSPVKTAQMILGNNSAVALKLIEAME